MLGWIIVAGLVVLGIYGISKTSGPGIFKMADEFLNQGNYRTFTIIQNPMSRSIKHIVIGFGLIIGSTLHAIEIKRGETKNFGKTIGTLIKVDVAANRTLTLPNAKPKTFERSGWMTLDDWSKIKPCLEPIKNLQYLFVD
jgi:hypothetical protein